MSPLQKPVYVVRSADLRSGAASKSSLFTPGRSQALQWEVHGEGRRGGLEPAYGIGGLPVKAQTWAGVTMVGELDVLELRDATRHTVARGRRDATLAEV